MRRIPNQIPDLVGRLLRANHIVVPPTWYAPVMANPPPAIAPQRLKNYTKANGKHNPLKAPKMTFLDIKYEEDEIRKHFFTDFPFEAYRPTSLVELRNISVDTAVSGKEWTRLEQRGENPTVEDTIKFVLRLKESGMPISQAYAQATEEFVKLRALFEMKTMAAELEARNYGADFKRSPFERYHQLERKHLDAHVRQEQIIDDSAAIEFISPKRIRWGTHIKPKAFAREEFTGGRKYTERWRIPPPPIDFTKAPAGLSAGAGTGGLGGDAADAAAEGEELDDLAFLKQALGEVTQPTSSSSS